jgi:ankyrin repeat protein
MRGDCLRQLLAIVVCGAVTVHAHGDVRLTEAARRDRIDDVRTLLKQGVDPNTPQADGGTALLWAAQWDDVEMADLLLRSGARVDMANDWGYVPLMMAATNGSALMLRRLLDAGAHADSALPDGETALMTAARTGRPDAVSVLLDAGADLERRETTKGQTALMWAVAEDNTEAVQLLVHRRANVGSRSRTGFTPLMFAARGGDAGLVALLLDHGAAVDETADDGSTALLVAVVRGHVDVAKLLLDRGADPNVGKAGFTPVHWAAGNWESATSISFGHESGEWGLMGGIPRERKVELLRALIAHGGDPNARVTKAIPLGHVGPTGGAGTVIGAGQLIGATPFFLASLGGDLETMRFLAANGADVRAATNDQTTALMAAAGTTGFSDLESSLSENDHLAAVALAQHLGVDPAASNSLGNTALHIAAHAGFDSVASFLLQHGVPVNAKNAKGETALRIADGAIVITMLYTHPSTAKMLRAAGGTY